jgi:hypothetical protein
MQQPSSIIGLLEDFAGVWKRRNGTDPPSAFYLKLVKDGIPLFTLYLTFEKKLFSKKSYFSKKISFFEKKFIFRKKVHFSKKSSFFEKKFIFQKKFIFRKKVVFQCE